MIVDSDQNFYVPLIHRLTQNFNGVIVDQVDFASHAMRVLNNRKFDVVLLDVDLPDADGYLLQQWVTEIFTDDPPALIFISTDQSADLVNKALDLGAAAYLDKASGPGEICSAIGNTLNII